MSDKNYDVAIIGAGVSGASIAYCLSRYNVNVILLEKEIDACFGVSKANSGIVHGGFHHETTTLKTKLEMQGNLMFDKLKYELNFPFRRNGIIVAAFTVEEMETVRLLYARGKRNGAPGIELCGRERILSLEPKLNPDTVGGLYAPNGGTIEPYRYVFSLIESAMNNQVDFLNEFKVSKTARKGNNWTITAENGRKITAKYAINAAGLFADEVSAAFGAEEFTIKPRKGEEYLLDRNSVAYTNHVVFPVPGKASKGVLVIPTVEGTTMVGPTAEMIDDKTDLTTTAANLRDIFTRVVHMVPGVSSRDIITAFAGLRPTMEGDDFYIDISQKVPDLIQVAGIQSPGLTASPAIGEYVKDLLKKDGLVLTEKTEIKAEVPAHPEVRKLTPEEVDELYKKNKAFTNIVCRCESISEAEIVDAIHKGHTTVDGIKFYTRAGMGRCQGGFCTYKILKLISRETGLSVEEITKRGGGSKLITGKLGEISPDKLNWGDR